MNRVIGVVLAGGKSSRMGGRDKALMQLGSKTMVSWVVTRALPQVNQLILSRNSNSGEIDRIGLPIVTDAVAGFVGPLAGILAALDWTAVNAPHVTKVVSFAIDTPFFPHDLVTRMFKACVAQNKHLCYAESGGRVHPTFGMWPVRLRNRLRCSLARGEFEVKGCMDQYGCAVARFDSSKVDPFFNINTPADFEIATKHLGVE